MRDEVVRL